MSINSQLLELYKYHWEALIDNGKKLNPAIQSNPMLLWLDETRFLAAKKRIVICGQELWGGDGFGTPIEKGMQSYRKFFTEEGFYRGYGKSAFWKAFRFLKKELRKLYGDNHCYFVWQNISKMCRNDRKTGVTSEIRQLERQFFPVIKHEMALLKPNIVIFLTGPDRDCDIKFHFSDAEFKPISGESNMRRASLVFSKDLPFVTLRLYHPSFYRGFTNAYKAKAIEQIRLLHANDCHEVT